jgi:excisionase family DNA binding protein
MLLSVAEAAELLGLTPRAVRGRLARGELPGRKQGRRWVIPRRALPLDAAAHRALLDRADHVREAVERALPSRGVARRQTRRHSKWTIL